MIWRILKKDLRRKRVINFIILVFVTLSTMFAASSVNNIITVTNGLGNYFEKAGMSDYFIATQGVGESSDEDAVTKKLSGLGSVKNVRIESAVFTMQDKMMKDGEYLLTNTNAYILMADDEAELNYFDSDNNVIKKVENGKAYITASMANSAGLEIGDRFIYKPLGKEYEFEYAGPLKDALFGSDFMGDPRFIISREDYDEIMSEEGMEPYKGLIILVDTDDISDFENEMPIIEGTLFKAPQSMIKKAYLMSMLVAGMLLAVSVCLIGIALVVLRFTIRFTLEEEFREIGVMKAIGLKNGSIRNLYLVKYFGISVIGAATGLFLSIPFGNMMLKSVSDNMNMVGDNTFLVSVICSVGVVALIMLFCFTCTHKVNKLSPIDAVRSGQTGERFHRNGLLRLGRSKLPTASFLALNDVLSSPKQYAIITAVFTLLMLMIMLLANMANTLSSDKLMFLFGIDKKDIYIADFNNAIEVVGMDEGGEEELVKKCREVEEILADNDMPANVTIEALILAPVTHGDKHAQINFVKNCQTRASDYQYTEGTPPQAEDEIALSILAAESVDAGIGDTVTVTVNGEEKDFIVTALFQSFIQTGSCGRFSELTDTSKMKIAGYTSFIVDFDDDPSDKEIDSRIERLKDIFDTDEIVNTEQFVKDTTGAADVIRSIKNMVIIISVLICLLITLLMERSFISREKAEIALMKAVGFKGRFISLSHTLKFTICAIAAAVIASAATYPFTKLVSDPIMGFMGAVSGTEYKIVPVEIFVVYPLIIIAAAAAGTFITTVFIKAIKASDTADIE